MAAPPWLAGADKARKLAEKIQLRYHTSEKNKTFVVFISISAAFSMIAN